MNKVKLEIKIPENKTIEYNGQKIEIVPFIDFSDQVALINEYVKDYFGDLDEVLISKTKRHIFEAECRLKNFIIQICTSINIDGISSNVYADSALWDKITEQITNWYDFRSTLDEVIYEIKEQEKLDNSLGKVLSDLIERAEGLLNKLTDISPEDIEKMQATGLELIDKLENANVMRNPSDLSAVEQPLIEGMKEGLKKE